MSMEAEREFWIEDGVLKEYHGPGGHVTVPAGVTGIGEDAFLRCTALTGLTVPEGVEYIDRSAFSGCCNLTEVALPGSLKRIGEFAFHDCGLTDLPAAPGLEQLERSAFSKCQGLTQITLYDGLKSLGRGVFFGCANLTDVTLPRGMERVGKNTFLECGGLVRFHAHPESRTLRDVDGILYDKDGASLLVCPNALTRVSVPEGVTRIGPEAFSDGAALELVTLPESLREIGEGAFARCGKLKELTLPAGLKRLGVSALAFCRELTSLVIPDGVEHIGAGAFQKCARLQWLRLPPGMALDLHWFVNPHDPECRSADLTTIPFATTRAVADIPSNMGKRYAALGFILADLAGVETDADIAQGYLEHIQLHLEDFHQELLTDVEILQWLIDHRLIGQEVIEGLLEKAAAGGHTAASAALLDYQNKNFSPKDQGAKVDLRFEQFEDAFSL